MNKSVNITYDEGTIKINIIVPKRISDFFEEERKRRGRVKRQESRYLSRYEFDESVYCEEGMLVENILLKKELYNKLYADINKLTKKQRRRIILYFFENLSYKEIAKIENVSISSVRESIQTALKFMAKNMKDF